jgi:hypothetical protein
MFLNLRGQGASGGEQQGGWVGRGHVISSCSMYVNYSNNAFARGKNYQSERR